MRQLLQHSRNNQSCPSTSRLTESISPPARVQTGAGGVHEGADTMDTHRFLRQPALHQPDRGQDGLAGSSR